MTRRRRLVACAGTPGAAAGDVDAASCAPGPRACPPEGGHAEAASAIQPAGRRIYNPLPRQTFGRASKRLAEGAAEVILALRRRVETRRWTIGKSAFADCGVGIRASSQPHRTRRLTALARTSALAAALLAATAPVPRAEAAAPPAPVVRAGGLRVVVAANSFAPSEAGSAAAYQAGSTHPHHPPRGQPGSPSTADSVDERVNLEALRSLYLASVRDEHSIAKGLAEIDRVRASTHAQPGSPLDATLAAYAGALVTLRAKHAFWPAQKLRYLREGLAILDRTIASHPDHAEARYLRLMSCYYLPGILGRSGSVRADFAALARLLPGVREQYPPQLYDAITRFVVERGRLPAEQRRALEDTLPAG